MDNNEVASQASSQLESAVHEVMNGNPIRQVDAALDGSISKNAQKRLMKAQKREQQKVERRAREKAAKAAKKEAKRKRELEGEEAEDRSSKKRKLDDGVLDGDEVEDQRVQKQQPRDKILFGSKIVIDLGFDDKMTEREIVSLVSQCAYSYSSNRKASTPFSALLFTSLNGRTKARLDMLATYQNWRGVEWWEEDYNQLWTLDGTEMQLDRSSEDKNQITRTFTCPVTSMVRHRTNSAKDKVVYLTADSDIELLELDPEETYVVGGIVDKNRYKALCKNKAQSQSIRTARLPIGIYLKELPTRKVLTVNQVVDILLKWVEYRDWRKALFDVIPMRKFHSEAKSTRRAKPENGASEVQTQGNNDVALEETLELGGKVCDGEIDSSQGDNT